MASLFVALRRSPSLASFPLRRSSFPLRLTSSRCISHNSISPSSSERKRIVTAVNPLYPVRLYDYFTHVKNVILLQDLHDTFFTLATYRSFKRSYDGEQFRKATIQTAAIYLSCGVDASKVLMFCEDLKYSFAEFSFLLLDMTPHMWLNEMSDCRVMGGPHNVSLFTYARPIHLATEHFIYKSNFILEDDYEEEQAQFTRRLAKRVNRLCRRRSKEVEGCGGTLLQVPEILEFSSAPQLMSDIHKLHILEDKDVIAKKLSQYDECFGHDILLSLYGVASGKTEEEVEMECESMDLKVLKLLLTDALIEHLHPIQMRYKELISDPAYLEDLLRRGGVAAEETANETLMDLREAVGLPRI